MPLHSEGGAAFTPGFVSEPTAFLNIRRRLQGAKKNPPRGRACSAIALSIAAVRKRGNTGRMAEGGFSSGALHVTPKAGGCLTLGTPNRPGLEWLRERTDRRGSRRQC